MSTPFLKFFHFIFVKSAFLLKGGAALAAGHPDFALSSGHPELHPAGGTLEDLVLPLLLRPVVPALPGALEPTGALEEPLVLRLAG